MALRTDEAPTLSFPTTRVRVWDVEFGILWGVGFRIELSGLRPRELEFPEAAGSKTLNLDTHHPPPSQQKNTRTLWPGCRMT